MGASGNESEAARLDQIYPPGYPLQGESDEHREVHERRCGTDGPGARRIGPDRCRGALGGAWLALSIVGLVPLTAGAFGFCLLAPLFHQPMGASGSREA